MLEEEKKEISSTVDFNWLKQKLDTGNGLQGDIITKTSPFNIQYFFSLKIKHFQRKNFDIFLIFAQGIDCGYTLEPPWLGGSNEYPRSMFWSIGLPLQTPAFLYKSGV